MVFIHHVPASGTERYYHPVPVDYCGQPGHKGDRESTADRTLGRVPTRLLVVAVAIGARLLAQLALGFYGTPEGWEYDEAARNVVSGAGYIVVHNGTTWQAASPPLYTFALVILYALFGTSSLPIGPLNAVLGGALALSAYAVARRLCGPNTALVAGLAVALHPGLLVYSAKIHALNMDAPVATLAILALLRLREHPDAINAALVGVVGGAAALTRPTVLPVTLLGATAVLLFVRPRSRALRGSLIVAVVALTLTAPWLARNQLVYGTASLQPTYGELLWRGNHAGATGGALAADGRPILEANPQMREAVWGRGEFEQEATFRAAALDYMRDDPLRTARNLAGRFWSFWWFGPQAGALYPPAWLLAYQAYYALAATLAVLGAVALATAGRRSELLLIGLSLVMVSVGQSLFYVEGRHRWTVEPLVVVLAAVGLRAALPRLRRVPERRRPEKTSPHRPSRAR